MYTSIIIEYIAYGGAHMKTLKNASKLFLTFIFFLSCSQIKAEFVISTKKSRLTEQWFFGNFILRKKIEETEWNNFIQRQFKFLLTTFFPARLNKQYDYPIKLNNVIVEKYQNYLKNKKSEIKNTGIYSLLSEKQKNDSIFS